MTKLHPLFPRPQHARLRNMLRRAMPVPQNQGLLQEKNRVRSRPTKRTAMPSTDLRQTRKTSPNKSLNSPRSTHFCLRPVRKTTKQLQAPTLRDRLAQRPVFSTQRIVERFDAQLFDRAAQRVVGGGAAPGPPVAHRRVRTSTRLARTSITTTYSPDRWPDLGSWRRSFGLRFQRPSQFRKTRRSQSGTLGREPQSGSTWGSKHCLPASMVTGT